MTGPWTLPTQAALGGGAYAIRTDYRDILELLRWLGGQATRRWIRPSGGTWRWGCSTRNLTP